MQVYLLAALTLRVRQVDIVLLQVREAIETLVDDSDSLCRGRAGTRFKVSTNDVEYGSFGRLRMTGDETEV